MQAPDTTSIHTLTSTLAHLSFTVPPERMAEFEVMYEAMVVPLLEKHNVVASSERRRPTPVNVFSRLFEMRVPSDIVDTEQALKGDPAWKDVLQQLGAVFGTPGPDGLMPYHFGLYAAPAVSGRTVSAGRGRGHWRTYDTTVGFVVRAILQDREGRLWAGIYGGGVMRYDGQTWTTFTTANGLASTGVQSMVRDHEGRLWIATQGGGVSRYDGQTWTTFTTQDGLASNRVMWVMQDRDRVLWFGTHGGVSRYDGATWTTFTTQDGLVSDLVWTIVQDRDGALWFGTYEGVSRYDGQTWTTFTTQDGLADNSVVAICQDRTGNLWFGTGGYYAGDGKGVSRYDGQTWTTFTTADTYYAPYRQ